MTSTLRQSFSLFLDYIFWMVLIARQILVDIMPAPSKYIPSNEFGLEKALVFLPKDIDDADQEDLRIGRGESRHKYESSMGGIMFSRRREARLVIRGAKFNTMTWEIMQEIQDHYPKYQNRLKNSIQCRLTAQRLASADEGEANRRIEAMNLPEKDKDEIRRYYEQFTIAYRIFHLDLAQPSDWETALSAAKIEDAANSDEIRYILVQLAKKEEMNAIDVIRYWPEEQRRAHLSDWPYLHDRIRYAVFGDIDPPAPIMPTHKYRQANDLAELQRLAQLPARSWLNEATPSVPHEGTFDSIQLTTRHSPASSSRDAAQQGAPPPGGFVIPPPRGGSSVADVGASRSLPVRPQSTGSGSVVSDSPSPPPAVSSRGGQARGGQARGGQARGGQARGGQARGGQARGNRVSGRG